MNVILCSGGYMIDYQQHACRHDMSIVHACHIWNNFVMFSYLCSWSMLSSLAMPGNIWLSADASFFLFNKFQLFLKVQEYYLVNANFIICNSFRMKKMLKSLLNYFDLSLPNKNIIIFKCNTYLP